MQPCFSTDAILCKRKSSNIYPCQRDYTLNSVAMKRTKIVLLLNCTRVKHRPCTIVIMVMFFMVFQAALGTILQCLKSFNKTDHKSSSFWHVASLFSDHMFYLLLTSSKLIMSSMKQLDYSHLKHHHLILGFELCPSSSSLPFALVFVKGFKHSREIQDMETVDGKLHLFQGQSNTTFHPSVASTKCYVKLDSCFMHDLYALIKFCRGYIYKNGKQ